ncbi:MAG TPA: 2-amino-4-hydroxy-6-hydroxymethyldihydropteridine diphosphokinase [Acidimicrobiales bacterium]
MRRAYLSLGSNIESRYQHLSDAIEVLARGEAYRLSPVFETEPVGGVAQENFWNLVMEIETEASPEELLERAHEAESAARRTREVHWGPRTLDVDVLLVGDERRESPELVVPHPRMGERAFVLVPLRELAPALVSDDALGAAQGEVRILGTLSSLRE